MSITNTTIRPEIPLASHTPIVTNILICGTHIFTIRISITDIGIDKRKLLNLACALIVRVAAGRSLRTGDLPRDFKTETIMLHKSTWKWLIFILTVEINIQAFAEAISNPCGNNNSGLLNILDRPTVGDSACVVPFGKALLEAGYQFQKSSEPGYQQNFPEAELRIGLPANNELVILPPNYVHQTIIPNSGFNATTVGIKHEIGYNKHWLGAVEALYTLPTGSNAFGSHGLGAAFNGIISYTFNPKFNLTFMLGGTTQTESDFNGGQRFNSINPDLVLTYAPADKLNFYAEIYAQTKTGPTEGSGSNCDAGIIYLLSPNFTVDLVFGQRISGNLGGFNHYIGSGLGILFS
jgi:hypothetical protein